MKKLFALIIALALLLTLAPTSVGAVGNGRIVAYDHEDSQGDTFWMEIHAEDFIDVASLDLYIYYDSSVLTLLEAETGDLLQGCISSVHKDHPGQIVLSTISLDGIHDFGRLLNLCFQVKDEAQLGAYPIRLALGNAYDTALQPITLTTQNGTITIRERQADKEYFWFSVSVSSFAAKQGDRFVMDYYTGTPFVSGEFILTYDPELVRLETAKISDELQQYGALVSINTATLGMIRVTCASLEAIQPLSFLHVEFAILTDSDVDAPFRFTAKNVYREDLVAYEDTDHVFDLQIRQDYEQTYTRSLILYWNDQFLVGEPNTVTVQLEAGAPVAAADFWIKFDPQILQCVQVTVREQADSNIWIVVNDNYTDGFIRFSYINLSGKNEDHLSLIDITFVPTGNGGDHPGISTGGSGVVDLNMQPVELAYPNAGLCIYRVGDHYPPECWSYGYTRYECIYCGYWFGVYHEDQPPQHQWEITNVVEPDCWNYGYVEYTCPRCGSSKTETDFDQEPGHLWEVINVVEPSCWNYGYTERACQRCGVCEQIDWKEPVHQWEVTYVYWEPAEYSVGIREVYCSQCGSAILQQFWDEHEEHFFVGGICVRCEVLDPDYSQPDCMVSEDAVYAAMMALQSAFPEGMPWTNDNYYFCRNNYTLGYGCAGFVFLLSDAAFGSAPYETISGHITIDQLRVGDILRVYNDTHSVIVLEVHEDYIVIAEGNYNSSIHWGRVMTAQEVADATDYVLTRYRNHTLEYQYTTEPTCTEPGYNIYTCHCGYIHYEFHEAALGHDWDEGVVIQEPTEYAEGQRQHTCYRCNETKIENIPALDHVHSYDFAVTDPTCIEQGYTTYTCRCGDTYISDYVDALGHDMGDWYTVTEPGCETQGQQRKDCSRCDHFETEVIPATGHSYTANMTAPTCTEQGYTTYTCHCGDSYVADYVDALGHDMGDWYTVTEPGCETEGQQRKDCSRCEHYETEVIPAAGHSYSANVTAPTCTEQGYTIYTCYCGDSYISDCVDALGHDMGDWYTVTEPGCEAEGQQRKDCSRCEHYETEVIPATGHSYSANMTAPTCTEQGYTTYTCHCGDSYIDSYVDALDHDWDEGVVIVEPAEQIEGQRLHTCQRCAATKVERIPALDHVHEYIAVVTAPTCTQQGYTTHTCRCGDSFVDSFVDALGHDYGAWYIVREATCITDGQNRRDCSCCEHYETKVIEATGHSHSANVTAPTCTEQGYTTHTCRCGDSYTDSFVDALGHDFGNWYTVTEATCTADGEQRRDCLRCDHLETKTIEATGHSFTEYISDENATVESDGTKTAHCDHGCGAIDTVTDPGSKLPMSEITSEEFQITEEYISGIAVGTTVETLLRGIHENAYVQVYKDGTEVSLNAILCTGMTLRLVINGQVMQELSIIVCGDTSGDGKISVTDMIAIKSHILKKTILTGAAAKAADVSGDGAISVTDFIQVKSHILGKSQVSPAETQVETVKTQTERAPVLQVAQPVPAQKQTWHFDPIACTYFLVPGRLAFPENPDYHKEF